MTAVTLADSAARHSAFDSQVIVDEFYTGIDRLHGSRHETIHPIDAAQVFSLHRELLLKRHR